ncbi:MAG: pantetheine-phosphate adenylyltransferase [Lachnospiraceae bacterium]|nr:pantetheine-phosphate adenylyltransferase [Lachnospiraceae bacterium]
MHKAVYPGSFDPLTYGHLDIIKRASDIFDELTVLVIRNSAKKSLFTVEERVEMIEKTLKKRGLEHVKVDTYEGLTLDYCAAHDIGVSIRGLRAITDFEYELQIAQTNTVFSKGKLETVFLTTGLKYAYLSSTIVKEIASYHGDVSVCVPRSIEKKLMEKYGYETKQHEE